jgi:hypothetical protein
VGRARGKERKTTREEQSKSKRCMGRRREGGGLADYFKCESGFPKFISKRNPSRVEEWVDIETVFELMLLVKLNVAPQFDNERTDCACILFAQFCVLHLADVSVIILVYSLLSF